MEVRMTLFSTERRVATELMHAIPEWIASFYDLPPGAVRKAPLNRSTRPLTETKIPDEYGYLVKEWVCQDLLFAFLAELRDAADQYHWDESLFPLAFELRGLRGHELVTELIQYRESLHNISMRPWYKMMAKRLQARMQKRPAANPQETAPQ